MKPVVYLFIIAVGTLLLPGCASSGKPKASLSEDDKCAQLEALRADVNTCKVRTFNQFLKLSAVEADKFCPVYRSYETELKGVGDRKLALVREFLAQHRA